MSSSSYHFVSNWLIDATPEEVYNIITDSAKLVDWWPAVYLDIKVLDKGGENGINKLIELYTKGWLPYTLRWKFRVVNVQKPQTVEIEALGDFIGHGKWTFSAAENQQCKVTYDWKIEAKKPLLKKLSWLMKPAFSANHEWAMKKGEESLKLEILHRKGILVGTPPKPTFPHNLLNNKIL